MAGLAGSSGSSARFFYPIDMAVDSVANVYVADAKNQKIRARSKASP